MSPEDLKLLVQVTANPVLNGRVAPPRLQPAMSGNGAAPLRPYIAGKFLFVGDEKFWIRGVTYGTFRPGPGGEPYPAPDVVDRDLTAIAANGFNTIRTYTVPPRWLLDAAHRRGLRVMVDLPWEQHVTFLDDSRRAASIEARVREGVRTCAGHPGVLGYALGNEIPAPIVRWHGRRRVERYLHRLYRAVKAEDPGALVTYVSYPTTEYLELPFLDFVAFNVYLESRERFASYLARLHTIAAERPLVITEVGFDSRRHGQVAQADTLGGQVRTAFELGCAGAFVFAWTDEWHRGDHDVTDWDFGLTARDRSPRPALRAVRHALSGLPIRRDLRWPRISVVVCSYNGGRTIRDCCEGLIRLRYPDFEVIVVNDGSSDQTPAIATAYGFRVITTENRGLSNARNTGLSAATGEIVAYLDDDARPDSHWLTYLASTFMNTTHVAVGGPNIAPPGDGPIAEAVANAPGGPIHVLLSDDLAEHIPGCNMAFRKEALAAIGGFDPQFRTAGDDVDVCWRIQERGWTIGFNPAAMVWHHRRNTIRAFWKQQQGYGKAEAMLAKKWPEKYNAAGDVTWTGRLYGRGLVPALLSSRRRIYHGTWGSAPYQSLNHPADGLLSDLATTPQWYLVIVALAALSALGILWRPLLAVVPLLAAAVGVAVLQAALGAMRATRQPAPRSRIERLQWRTLVAGLYLLQPLARLLARLRESRAWRAPSVQGRVLGRARTLTIWSERWQNLAERLQSLEARLRTGGALVRRGGSGDRWDLEVAGGLLGVARMRAVIEEHGDGKQLLRLRAWPRCSGPGLALTTLLIVLMTGAGLSGAWTAGAIVGTLTLFALFRTWWECAAAMTAVVRAATARLHEDRET